MRRTSGFYATPDHGGGGLVSKSCLTLATPWTVAYQALCPWDFPGKNTGVGCRFLLYSIVWRFLNDSAAWDYLKTNQIQSLPSRNLWSRKWELCINIIMTPVLHFTSSHWNHTALLFQFSSVQLLSHVRLFATPWIAARQASLSITISWSSLRLTSIESVIPSSHLILCCPFPSCPQSLPASESFPMSQLSAWGGQSTGVSALASFLSKNT